MFDLKCKKVNCVYNKSANCNAKHIKVTKETECDTFKASKEAEIGVYSEIKQVPIRKNIEVVCDAKCIFNDESKCTANGITVQPCTSKHCPNCCTFQPE